MKIKILSVLSKIFWILAVIIFLLALLSSNANWSSTIVLASFCIMCAIVGSIVKTAIIRQEELQATYLEEQKQALRNRILYSLHIPQTLLEPTYDHSVRMVSARAVDTYNASKYLTDMSIIERVKTELDERSQYVKRIGKFLEHNEFESELFYEDIAFELREALGFINKYTVLAYYISPAGRSRRSKSLNITYSDLRMAQTQLESKPKSASVSKSDKAELYEQQQRHLLIIDTFIKRINVIKDQIIIDNDLSRLDDLYDTSISLIREMKRIKTADSVEWSIFGSRLDDLQRELSVIEIRNNDINRYYNSQAFAAIKVSCEKLMSSQREFNEYIDEKVQSISELFGKRVERNATKFNDAYAYTHTYSKDLTPFTANVTSSVFSSAENDPLKYVVKYFYDDKSKYVEQIQKLQFLVAELETLEEARTIIEINKKQLEEYFVDVPDMVLKYDEDGFYSRLGFAVINEKRLTVSYRFVYTSEAGMAQRSFDVPMTEDTIIKLIDMLSNKLTYESFVKEQRSLMTKKLREAIKKRDNYTCKYCGNSIYKEPNLLLEVDHIVPVKRGGYTVENNLQTLCWRCNRSKSANVSDEVLSNPMYQPKQIEPVERPVVENKNAPKVVKNKRSEFDNRKITKAANNDTPVVSRTTISLPKPEKRTLVGLTKSTNKLCRNCSKANLNLVEQTSEFKRYQCPNCGKRYKKLLSRQ